MRRGKPRFGNGFLELLVRNLTKHGEYDLLWPLQPKSGFLPGAGCGRPKILSNEDGAYEARQLVSRPLSRPSPTANLVGNWKGDPLIREVRGLKFTPSKIVAALSRPSRSAADWTFMLDVIYLGTAVLFFAVFALYARGCEKL
jgi:hypothetical protein